MEQVRWWMAKYPPERKRSAVMPLLYMAQEEYGYCSDEAIKEVAETVGCPLQTAYSRLVSARKFLAQRAQPTDAQGGAR